MSDIAGKRIVVGITGSISAYKVAGWVSALTKAGAKVSVVMTDGAQKFMTPLTFAALTGEAPYTAMFEDDFNRPLSHIDLATAADLFLVAPASAQTIARLAFGMADDLLSAAVLATRAKVIVCPAMNSNMYLHQATQENIERLRELGYTVIEPDSGMMACKTEGPGRLPEWERVEDLLYRELGAGDLAGQRFLITAGPTREPLDPARFISNRSSGKMGYALARMAWRRGADVVLVSGPTSLPAPQYISVRKVETAKEMYNAVLDEYDTATVVIKAAAVSDFAPQAASLHKVKKEAAELSIPLKKNPDILFDLGQKKRGQILVGFAAETDNLIDEGRRKLQRKNLDLIVVNQINSAESGFEADTNRVILIDNAGDNAGAKELPLCSKLRTAGMILDAVVERINH